MPADPTGFIYAASKDVAAVEALSGDLQEHAEVVCFHAQQAAEKMLKDVYVSNGDVPPRTHQLEDLLREIIRNGWLTASQRVIEAAGNLSVHAVAARYQFAPQIDAGEALQAIADCNEISRALGGAGYRCVEIASHARRLREEPESGFPTPRPSAYGQTGQTGRAAGGRGL